METTYEGMPVVAMDDARPSDAVDRVQADWSRLRPELDTGAIGIVGRVMRSAALIQQRSDEVMAHFGLIRGEFDILAALRRAGSAQSPGRLRDATLAKGSATTKRLRSLEQRGLIHRSTHPHDGRSALIELTDAGRAMTDAVFPIQLEAERSLLGTLTTAETSQAVEALRDVLAAIEAALAQPTGGSPSGPGHRARDLGERRPDHTMTDRTVTDGASR